MRARRTGAEGRRGLSTGWNTRDSTQRVGLMSAFREFLLILAGGVIGTVLGAGFGALVGFVSPEFMDALTHPYPIHTPVRVGMAMGMIGGLLVGAMAMA